MYYCSFKNHSFLWFCPFSPSAMLLANLLPIFVNINSSKEISRAKCSRAAGELSR